MKKNKISYSLNLDNIRCFLYGAGTNDILSNAEIYKTPVLSGDNSNEAFIGDRELFLVSHFPPYIKDIYKRYTDSFNDDKKKTEFLTEISTRHSSIRGTVSFLDEIQKIYADDDNALLDTVNQNKKMLKDVVIRDFGIKVLHLIDAILPEEKRKIQKKKTDADYICHILLSIRDKLAKTIELNHSTDSLYRFFSLLLIAALLKEKFPVVLINSNQLTGIKDSYWIRSIVSAVQINLNVLVLQLQEHDSFLKECNNLLDIQLYQESEQRILGINEYYDLKIQQLDSFFQNADLTNLSKIIEKENLDNAQEYALFLHHIYYYVDSFAKAGLKRIRDYITLVVKNKISSTEEIKTLIIRYMECISFLRNLIYWNIVGLYSLLPSEITRELHIYAALTAPSETNSFLTLTRMDSEDIQQQLTLNEGRFRHSITNVQNASIRIAFPNVFYSTGFCKYVANTKLEITKPVRIITGKSNGHCEKDIIDEFFIQFELMDRLCNINNQILSVIISLSQNAADKNMSYSQLSKHILSYEDFLYKIRNSSTVLIQEPLLSMLYQKRIDIIELQHFFSQPTDVASTFLHDILEIKNNFLTEELKIRVINSLKSQHYQVEYLRRTPNYWFAEWDSESLSYIEQKLDNLVCLKTSVEEWKSTRKEAELWINSALDEMENDLSAQEVKIADDMWDILELKVKLKETMSRFHS